MSLGYEAYSDLHILSADPVELVRILYRSAIGEVARARRHLAEGGIRERSRAITKTLEILLELTHSLNHDKGGDLSRNLAELYDYMQRRLTQANVDQSDEPLAEVERLLRTLSEAWQAVEYPAESTPVHAASNPAFAPPPSGSWADPIPAEDVPERTSRQSWSA